jgi:phage-related holin
MDKTTVLAASAGGSLLASFVAPIEANYLLLVALAVLVVLDWVSALNKAYIGRVPITSRRMREGLSKLVGYLALIACAVVADVLVTGYLQIGKTPVILALVTGYLCGCEGLSVTENVYAVTRIRIPFLDRVFKGMTQSEEQEGADKKGQ